MALPYFYGCCLGTPGNEPGGETEATTYVPACKYSTGTPANIWLPANGAPVGAFYYGGECYIVCGGPSTNPTGPVITGWQSLSGGLLTQLCGGACWHKFTCDIDCPTQTASNMQEVDTDPSSDPEAHPTGWNISGSSAELWLFAPGGGCNPLDEADYPAFPSTLAIAEACAGGGEAGESLVVNFTAQFISRVCGESDVLMCDVSGPVTLTRDLVNPNIWNGGMGSEGCEVVFILTKNDSPTNSSLSVDIAMAKNITLERAGSTGVLGSWGSGTNLDGDPCLTEGGWGADYYLNDVVVSNAA